MNRNNPTQINQGGAENQEQQPKEQTGWANGDIRPADDTPSDGKQPRRGRKQQKDETRAKTDDTRAF